jgi:hypothetical protein
VAAMVDRTDPQGDPMGVRSGLPVPRLAPL